MVDDVLPPWQPRFVEVRGTVKAFNAGGNSMMPGFAEEILRLTPTHIISLGLNEAVVMTGGGLVNHSSRKVN